MSTERKKHARVLPIPTEVWLDYLEGNLDETFKKDLELVLKNNPQYKITLNQLREIKSNLKDNIKQIPSDGMFAKMKTKIMKGIDGVTPEAVDVKVVTQNEMAQKAAGKKQAAVKLTSKIKTNTVQKNKTHVI